VSHSGTIIHMRNVPPKGDAVRALDAPLPCKMWPGWKGPEEVEVDFEWDGASSGIFAPLFPKWNHPIATCRHDWRCKHAKNPEQRAWADREFKKDVGTTSWWITKQTGYLGVRAGALLGIGVNYK
jgi:hypothetical protein